MEWYLPMTIIPGVGLIILSTSNIMLALNNEITQLKSGEDKFASIIISKLSQLKRLSISIVFQYSGLLLFLFSGILRFIFPEYEFFSRWILFIGVGTISASIILLLVYSTKAVLIRQEHLKL